MLTAAKLVPNVIKRLIIFDPSPSKKSILIISFVYCDVEWRAMQRSAGVRIRPGKQGPAKRRVIDVPKMHVSKRFGQYAMQSFTGEHLD